MSVADEDQASALYKARANREAATGNVGAGSTAPAGNVGVGSA